MSPAMIDFTPALSRAYSARIEAETPAPSEDDIHIETTRVLRTLSSLDVGEALHDDADAIRHAVLAGDRDKLATIVSEALTGWARSVAIRNLEA